MFDFSELVAMCREGLNLGLVCRVLQRNNSLLLLHSSPFDLFSSFCFHLSRTANNPNVQSLMNALKRAEMVGNLPGIGRLSVRLTHIQDLLIQLR